MTGIPEVVDTHMRRVLQLVTEAIKPGSSYLVKRHVWRNIDYVGSDDGKIVEWRGWSANLRKVDARYKTIYIDYVENLLGPSERLRLFGELFTTLLENKSRFIFLYVTSCSFSDCNRVTAEGFVYRRINEVIHPGIILEIKSFLDNPASNWTEYGMRLLNLQHHLTSGGKSSDDQ
jgi:hypothetical protein